MFTSNFKDVYTVGFPFGINILKSDRFGVSFKVAPIIRTEKNVAKVSTILFHLGAMFRFHHGFTFIGRVALETNWRFGVTPVFNKVIKKGKMSACLFLFLFRSALAMTCRLLLEPDCKLEFLFNPVKYFYIFVSMGKLVVAVLLACFFLTGSTLLPLGDFSLMKDIPSMYRSYCKVRVGTPDPVDFIGDYMLGGKDLLGHNQNDAPAKSDSSLQFQHQAISFLVVLFCSKLPALFFAKVLNKPVVSHLLRSTTDYNSPLFRPPLA